jgi:Spy/CpxP family protein refolding chaperone
MRKIVLLGISILAGASFAADKAPYAGEELRSIKSLSPQEVESLRSGQGMGFAKLAELNHYPGPKHVLELADDLELTPSQRARTEEIFKRMQDRAVALGEQLLEAEIDLGRHFEDGTIDPQSLEDALLRIGEIRGRLRHVHMNAHLEQKRVLTAQQITKYDEIRGYLGSASNHTEHHESHH